MGLFKKKKKKYKLIDIEGVALSIGDNVEAMRYELGKCKIVEGENGPEYQSIKSGEKVSFAKMIDAHTLYQKVKKI